MAKYDYSKLKGRIVEKVGTQRRFSELIGVSEHTLSSKLCSHTPWTQTEIAQSCEVLDISPERIAAYFFTREVQ